MLNVRGELLRARRPLSVARCEANVLERDATLRVFADRVTQVRQPPPDLPLSGMCFATKDMFLAEGLRTRYGSRAFAGAQPDLVSAPLVAHLETLGAVHMGKTHMSEMALYQPSTPLNPHDPGRTAGGSSNGSAVCVAAGMAHVAIGSQTGGSIIRPAAYNGVFGFKPTLHLLPTHGMLSISPSLDTAGLFAGNLADLRRAVYALLRFDASADNDADHAGEDDPTTLTIGVLRDPSPLEPMEAEQQECLEQFCAQVAPHATAVVDVRLPAEYDLELNFALAQYEGASNLRHLTEKLGEHSPGVGALLERWAEVGTEKYLAARDMAEKSRAAFDEAMRGVDLVVAPSAKGVAPTLAECEASGWATGDPFINSAFTMFGNPCLHLPVGTDPCTGMPVGVQIVGRRGGDAALLRAAARLLQVLLRDPHDPAAQRAAGA